MRERTWRQRSSDWIAACYIERKAKDPEMPDEKLIKIISRNDYPFGGRTNYPYKAWLLAIKDFKDKLLHPHQTIEGPLFSDQVEN